MNPKEKAAMLADREIKAIVFDLGDTIFNFGEVRAVDLFRKSARLSYEYIKSAGQEPGGYKSYCFFNMAGLRLKILWSNITGNDFNSIDVLKSIGRKRGIRLSDEQWQEVNWMWYKSLEEITTIEADIVETLSRLKEAGVALGIISNTFVHRHALERHLEEAGILEFFETRLYSYQFKWRKPDKRIFLAAAERMGVERRKIAYVGDRIDKDVCGAINAGMVAVLKRAYTSSGKKVPDGAEVIDKISELPGLLGL